MPVIHSSARIDSDAAIAAGGESALAREVVRFLIEELHIDGVSPDAHVHPISGGITNGLLRVTRQHGHDAVLVRLFGKNTEYLIDRDRDNALFEYLGETGVGPHLYAVFGNGRVEQMLHAKALAPEEMRLRQPVDVLAAVTHAIADFHALPAPGVSAAPVLWKVCQRYESASTLSAHAAAPLLDAGACLTHALPSPPTCSGCKASLIWPRRRTRATASRPASQCTGTQLQLS